MVSGEGKDHSVERRRRAIGLASVDLGVNALASVVVEDGAWLLYKGVMITEVYFHLQGRIFQIQSLADRGQGSRGILALQVVRRSDN